MPEYDITLKIGYYAVDEEQAHQTARDLAENVFVFDDVNDLEASVPVWRKDDE